MSGLASGLLSWMATYLLHSSLLILVVLAVTRTLTLRSNAVREWLWTVALFGGLLTASVQVGAGLEPLGGTLRLPLARQAQTPEPAPPRVIPLPPAPLSLVREASSAPALPVGAEKGTPARSSVNWRAALPWAGAFCLILGPLSLLALLQRKPRRYQLSGGQSLRILRSLEQRAGLGRTVILSVSDRIVSPVAMGIFRPEICLPARALEELGPEQTEAMLAHELAHLVRKDPVRLMLCRFVEMIFFWQPLNRMARRQLFQTVECRCDAWAVRQVGGGLPLAECLAEVAGWITDRTRPVPSLAMAEPGSPLSQRVRRLLADGEALSWEDHRQALAPCLALALPLLVLLSPAVRTTRAEGLAPQEPVLGITVDSEEEKSTVSPRIRLIAEAVDLLGEEIDLLQEELTGLRLGVATVAVSPEVRNTLARLERQVESLNQRRQLLAAWKTRMLREVGSDSSWRMQGTSDPRSVSR
ncbi:MAG: M56 family metallopeptidase [Planctomycetota bacterium]